MARAMSANLGEGANSRRAKLAILGRRLIATYGFTKAKIVILGMGASDKGSPLPQRGVGEGEASTSPPSPFSPWGLVFFGGVGY